MVSVIIALALLILVAAATFLMWPALGDGREYLPNTEEIRWLGSTTIVKDEKGRRAFGRASHELRGGLNVLKLTGSHYEMGFQHGILLKDEIHKGPAPYYARLAENFAPFKHMNALARALLAKYFDWKIYRPLLKSSPREYLAEIKGIADGSGLSFADAFRGNTLSDINMNLVKVLEKKALTGNVETGCTSFAAFGEATESGNLIMGRNTDYSGGGLWDTNQTVVFYEPEDGYKFANVSSAGLVKCNSCMNEKGICLGAHFLFLNDTRPDGVSFTFLEFEIMKKANSVDDAIDIVKKNPRAGAFAFVVADGKTNEAVVIEASAGNVGVRRPEDGIIWETNMGTTEEIKPVDVLLRNGIGKNPIARFARMQMLADENRGLITPEVAAQFMGDHMDMCSDSMRPVGGIISQGSNITSAVFSPKDFNFWVADGLCPVCNNDYLGFNLMAELEDDGSASGPAALPANDYVHTDDYKALRKFYEAAVSYMIPPTNEAVALNRLEEAIAIKPEESIYRRLVAKIRLNSLDAMAASEHLKHALACVQSPSELAQTHLLLGFCNDLLGMRNEAVICYQEVLKVAESAGKDILSSVNRFVVADAKKYSEMPFKDKEAEKLEVGFEVTSRYDY